MREKTGKRYKSFEDLERRWPRIPDGLISSILYAVRLPIGIYGSTYYSRCIYGISYGIYGVGSYDDCYYYRCTSVGVYGSGSYGDCIYN